MDPSKRIGVKRKREGGSDEGLSTSSVSKVKKTVLVSCCLHIQVHSRALFLQNFSSIKIPKMEKTAAEEEDHIDIEVSTDHINVMC